MKRVLSLVLCLVMLLGVSPVGAYAAESGEDMDDLLLSEEISEELFPEEPLFEEPAEENPIEENPIEENPIEEIPVEEIPVEEIPVEEVPAEEIPTEETHAEESLEEPADTRILVKFASEPEKEFSVSVWNKEEKEKDPLAEEIKPYYDPEKIRPEERGYVYLLEPDEYIYTIECDGFEKIEKESLKVAADKADEFGVQKVEIKLVREEEYTEEPSAEEIPTGEAPAEEIPAEEVPAEEVPVDETPEEEAYADEIPVDEIPEEEAPAEEIPVDEPIEEEIPAAEDTPDEENPDEENTEEELTPAEDPETLVPLVDPEEGDPDEINAETDPNKALATPSLKSISNVSGGVELTWGKVSGAYKYAIFRKSGSGSWSKLSVTASTSYTDKSAVSGTRYSYTVRCQNSVGSYVSAYNTTGLSITYIAAPAISSVSIVNGGVKLNWSKVTGASKYAIYRKSSVDNTFRRISVSTDGTYTDKNVVSGVFYYYRLRCMNSSGVVVGAEGNIRGLTYYATPVLKTLSNTADGVYLTWGKVTGASKYAIYRKASTESSYRRLTVSTGTSYTDKSAVSGTNYYYRIICMNASGDLVGLNSTPKTIKYYAAPVIKSISNTTGGVQLTWSSVSTASKYAIYRKSSSESSYKRLSISTTTSYTDKSAASGTYYYYRIQCMNSSGTLLGAKSNAKGITYYAAPVIKSIANVNGGVQLTWGKVTGAAKYAIYRKSSSESGYKRLSISTTTSYTDKSAVSGTYYYYRIQCMNSAGTLIGAKSNAKGITYYALPVIKSISNQKAGVKITWGKVTGVSKYAIYRKASTESDYRRISVTTGTSYTDQSAVSGTYYYYRVKCLNASGTAVTGLSGAKAITFIAAPTLQSISYYGGVKLTWSSVKGAVKYAVLRKTSGGSWSRLTLTTSTTYTDKSTSHGVRYYYTVRCVNSSGSYVSGYDATGLSLTTPVFRAILIGETNYTYNNNLPSDKNVNSVRTILNKMDKMGWVIYSRIDASESTINSVISSVASSASSSDVTLFYYSGHGYVNSGSYYAGALSMPEDNRGTEYITMSELSSRLSAIPGKVIVMLDSCGSGAAILTSAGGQQIVNEFDPAAFNDAVVNAFAGYTLEPNGDMGKAGDLATSKFYVLTAATYDQESWHVWWNDGRATSLFLQGIGECVGFDTVNQKWSSAWSGDSNGDNVLSLSECYSYTRSAVYRLSASYDTERQDVKVYPSGSIYPIFFK